MIYENTCETIFKLYQRREDTYEGLQPCGSDTEDTEDLGTLTT